MQENNYLKQHNYYSAGNSKLKYKHNATATAAHWRERSPSSGDPSSFCNVSIYSGGGYTNAINSIGVSSAFKV